MNTAPTWNHKQEIPSQDRYVAYMEREGRDSSGYGEWVASVETVKANNAKPATTGDPAPSVPATSPPRKASGPVVHDKTVMPHQRVRSKAAPTEVMSVRVRPGTGERIDAYRAKYRASKQEVVSDVLDAFLKANGF